MYNTITLIFRLSQVLNSCVLLTFTLYQMSKSIENNNIIRFLYKGPSSRAKLILMNKVSYGCNVTDQSSWSSDNASISGMGGLRFKFRNGQIEHSAANSLPPLQHFCRRSCGARAQQHGDGSCQFITRFSVLQQIS